MSKTKIIVLRLAAILAITVIIILAIVGFSFIPDFYDLFHGFGAELPLLTKLYLATYKYWMILAIFPLVIFIRTFNSKYKLSGSFGLPMLMLVGHIVLGVLIFAGGVFAMYAPIFELGGSDELSQEQQLRYYDLRDQETDVIQNIASTGSYRSIVLISYGDDNQFNEHQNIAKTLVEENAPINAIIQARSDGTGSVNIYLNGHSFKNIEDLETLKDSIQHIIDEQLYLQYEGSK